MEYKINEHVLDGSTAWGNGGHGHCVHCGLALVTDLGYCSWDGVKCIDREPKTLGEFPGPVVSFARFNGLLYNNEKKIFSKPYSDIEYTIPKLLEVIDNLIVKHEFAGK